MVGLVQACDPAAPKGREEIEADLEPTRVRAKIVPVAALSLTCPHCTEELLTTEPRAMVMAGKRGSVLPPMRCICGRVLIGYTPLVEVAG
jgi:hypothetical protein